MITREEYIMQVGTVLALWTFCYFAGGAAFVYGIHRWVNWRWEEREKEKEQYAGGQDHER
jgi:hypothetical protein